MCDNPFETAGLFITTRGDALMHTYPLMLNLQGKDVLVIGGGTVAHRKISNLLPCGAIITIISPELHPELLPMWHTRVIDWKQKRFAASDMETVPTPWLIIAATNEQQVNAQVAQLTAPHQFVNVVDQPELSTFHVPAILRRGKLTITVSTEGASPYLAKRMRDEIAAQYDETYEPYVEFLAQARTSIKHNVADPLLRRRMLAQLTESQYRRVEEQTKFIERMSVYGR